MCVLLSQRGREVEAWPLRRCFAITPETFAASRFLQAHTVARRLAARVAARQAAVLCQQGVFAGDFKDHCIPRTLFFSELSGDSRSRVSPLSPGETMARLIRMSPWSCYDRSTAADHLAVLSASGEAGHGLLAARRDATCSIRRRRRTLIAGYTCG